MFPSDKLTNQNHKILMEKIKELNMLYFWSQTLARRSIATIHKIMLFRKIIKKYSPYDLSSERIESTYNSDEKIVIYTVIFGEYDKIIEPLIIPNNCDYYIITDQILDYESNWKVINVNLSDFGLENKSNLEINRYFKMHPHIIFSSYKYSIYVDGNIKILTDLTEYIIDMNVYGLKLHNHYRQKCIFKEIEKCIKMKKDLKDNLIKHREHLILNKMPKYYGLLEAGIIVREHNNTCCIKIMDEWWREFERYSKRDQISLPYVLWKNGININEINTLGNDLSTNFSFQKNKHI